MIIFSSFERRRGKWEFRFVDISLIFFIIIFPLQKARKQKIFSESGIFIKRSSKETKRLKRLLVLKQPDSQMLSIPLRKFVLFFFFFFDCKGKQAPELPCWLFPLGMSLISFPWDLLASSADTWGIELFWKKLQKNKKPKPSRFRE